MPGLAPFSGWTQLAEGLPCNCQARSAGQLCVCGDLVRSLQGYVWAVCLISSPQRYCGRKSHDAFLCRKKNLITFLTTPDSGIYLSEMDVVVTFYLFIYKKGSFSVL